MKDAVLKTSSFENIRANAARLIESIKKFSEIGHIQGTKRGIKSLALDDNNIKERIEIIQRMERMGLEVRIDPIGNVFGIYPGQRSGRAVTNKDWVLTGSHTDSVVTGGQYDGRVGVLGGLEAIQSIKDAVSKGKMPPPQDPIVVADWVAEEGARYKPAMFGSAYFTGKSTYKELCDAPNQIDGAENITFGQALENFKAAIKQAKAQGLIQQDYSLNMARQPVGRVKAFLEMHIEQGPALNDANKEVEIATVGLGISQRFIEITTDQKDAIAAAFDTVINVRKIAKESSSEPRGTVGVLKVIQEQQLPEPTQHQMHFDIVSFSDHAGGCPMHLRRDSGYAAAAIYQAAREIAGDDALVIASNIKYGVLDTNSQEISGITNQVPDHVSFSIGLKECNPELWGKIQQRVHYISAELKQKLPAGEGVRISNSACVPITKISTQIKMTADIRNNDKAIIDADDEKLNAALKETSSAYNAEIKSTRSQRLPEGRFSAQLANLGYAIMESFGYKHAESFTVGAGHDSHNIAERRSKLGEAIPTAMVIIRNTFGSHNVKEQTSPKAQKAGISVLTNMLAKIACHEVELDKETQPAPTKEDSNLILSFNRGKMANLTAVSA